MKELLFLFFLFSVTLTAQTHDHADSLRGSLTPERTWWDLQHYELRIKINPEKKTLSGSNKIRFQILDTTSIPMQIDLQEPMQIDSVEFKGQKLTYNRDQAVYYIYFPETYDLVINKEEEILIYFSGQPTIAKKAPWDGGIVWDKDLEGNHFAASAVQGIGASSWWPTKEHSYDKPEKGVDLFYTTDSQYSVIGNGRLINTSYTEDGNRTWHWQVKHPISNYNISFNLGKYTILQDTYTGLKGNLDLTYYPLAIYKQEAKTHFAQVMNMLEAMEYWFGPYPFYEDSYKLTQAPFVGMEHQSNVAWGNGFQQGYTGHDLSNTGYGLEFDFMIVHESIHEWFGNNVTHNDIADMWIHEGFTSYGEALYVEYFFGKEAGQAYTRGTRDRIANLSPIQGKYGIHDTPSSDMYFKGANMLLTLRQFINDDILWRKILHHIQEKFKYTTIDSKTIESEISKLAQIDLTTFFDVYLRQAKIPTLEWYIVDTKLYYRYQDVPEQFNMPLRIKIDSETLWFKPTTKWQKIEIAKNADLQIDHNFYINEIQVHSK